MSLDETKCSECWYYPPSREEIQAAIDEINERAVEYDTPFGKITVLESRFHGTS